MTSFRGGTAGWKSAVDRNLEICLNWLNIGNGRGERETKLVSKYAEGSISYTFLRDFMAVFLITKRIKSKNTFFAICSFTGGTMLHLLQYFEVLQISVFHHFFCSDTK